VELVENDKIKVLRVRNYRLVQGILPGHEKFEHHEVGKENIGTQLSNSFSFFGAFLASVSLERRAKSLGKPRLSYEFPEFLDLAVSKGVHRIDDDPPSTGSFSRNLRPYRSIDNRYEKTERFA
jgi:hypothetical protein